MLVKPFTAKLSNVGAQVFLRCDPKYRHFWDNKKGVSLNQKKHSNVKIKNVLLPYTKKTIQKGPLDDERLILELNDVESRTSIILQERTVSEAGSTKLAFGDCDLVFNKLEPYLGKIVINDITKDYIGTTEWMPLKLDKNKIQEVYFKYILLLKEFLRAFWLLRSGKRHARIAQIDFQNMLIPLLPEKQVRIVNQIKPIETRMVETFKQLFKPLDLVNNVLAQEFKYGLVEYEERRKIHVYTAKFQDLDKSLLARCSVRYQHPKYEYLDDILRYRKWVKLKILLNAPIQRGVQPKYKKNSDFYVIKTANLKNDYIELDDTQMATKEFYEEKRLVAGIEKNDVLIASTGVGSIGKVDLYEFNEPAIADGHISIVKFDEKRANPKYMTYYLRSILGYLNVERNYVGATNQIEIYPNQLEQIRIIELTRKEQDEIVKKIHYELENLRKKKQKVIDLRNEIDKMILQVLK